MTCKAKIADIVVGLFIKAICRIDDRDIGKIPAQGPLIIVTNHINFLEVPVIHLVLSPRRSKGVVKRESWDNRFFAFLADAWGAIPIERGTTDFKAFRKSMEHLKSGGIICIAPEGTRSKTGRLAAGHGGVVSLALHGNVPIIPLLHYGGEEVWKNLRRLRRTKLCFKAGRPFSLRKPNRRLTSETRKDITREIMFQMALNLPEKYRGFYSDVENATTRHIEFLETT